MTKIVSPLYIALLLLVANSCAEEIQPTQKTFFIEFGSECGWCAGQEYIKISEAEVTYSRNIPCGDEEGTITKSRSISADKWDSIKNSFDFDLFLSLDYNECNVCADGCDEIIRITDNGDTHQLRYSPSTNIDGLENLQEKLMLLLIEMREAD